MDNKREKNSGGYGTRRVKGAERKKRPVRVEAPVTDTKRRVEKRSKKREFINSRIRAAAVLAAAAILAVILLFMTPIFNISEIRVEGNSVVELQMIKEKIGDLIGSNLFSIRKSKIESRLLEISQISDARVKKNIIPPSLTITIEESLPAAYMLSGSNVIVVDSGLKVIDDSGHYNTDDLPSVSGISVPSYKLNEPLHSDSPEKEEILQTLLYALDKAKLLDKVTYISVDDLTDLRFNYDNRLEVRCGSQLELERKIRMFREALSSESISSNSIGTMDLSVTGQAVYTP